MKISGSPFPLVIVMLCLFIISSCKAPENDLPEDINLVWRKAKTMRSQDSTNY
ncbi:MAG: hypothetical protein ISS19_16355 [Bacteroidales bacterium]|nr:hypothetical protein [Bacteroidales bacterium]